MKSYSLSLLESPQRSWFFRYKIYHIPFWFAYHYLSWSLLTSSFIEPARNILTTTYSIKFSFYVVFQAIGVYFNFYFLMPRFLERGKYIVYTSLVLTTILFTALCIVPGYYVSAHVSNRTFEELFRIPLKGSYWHLFKINALPSTIAAMTLGMSLKLTKNWIQAQQRERRLETEKLETELKFLRMQFNPHFLFNTINSIFVLINKNPRKASASLAKFSDLLRYQLYECNDQQISLTQELSYIENFVELEKLRQEGTTRVMLEIDKPYVSYLLISPFIIMPFIENAFKHVSHEKKGKSWINIVARQDYDHLYLFVSNSLASANESSKLSLDGKGIGLKNVKRRLELLYPEAHELSIEKLPNQFRVELYIELKRDVERERRQELALHQY